MSKKKKIFEPPLIKKSPREPILDDDTLQCLSKRSLYLYRVIMMQSANMTHFSITFSVLFGYESDVFESMAQRLDSINFLHVRILKHNISFKISVI
jgi:hypothetical protein